MRFLTYEVFLERIDLQRTEYLERIVRELLNRYITYLKDAYHRAFIAGQPLRNLGYFATEIDGNEITLVIDKEDNKSFGSYDGKKKIRLRSNELVSSLYQLTELHKQTGNKENVLRISQEKLAEICDMQVWEKYINVIIHELTHYFDNKKYSLLNVLNNEKVHLAKLIKRFDVDDDDTKQQLIDQLYYNTNHEYNAYFIQAISKFLKDFLSDAIMTYHSWEQFREHFFSVYFDRLEQFDYDYRKRILKRAYDFYNTVKKLM